MIRPSGQTCGSLKGRKSSWERRKCRSNRPEEKHDSENQGKEAQARVDGGTDDLSLEPNEFYEGPDTMLNVDCEH